MVSSFLVISREKGSSMSLFPPDTWVRLELHAHDSVEEQLRVFALHQGPRVDYGARSQPVHRPPLVNVPRENQAGPFPLHVLPYWEGPDVPRMGAVALRHERRGVRDQDVDVAAGSQLPWTKMTFAPPEAAPLRKPAAKSLVPPYARSPPTIIES